MLQIGAFVSDTFQFAGRDDIFCFAIVGSLRQR